MALKITLTTFRTLQNLCKVVSMDDDIRKKRPSNANWSGSAEPYWVLSCLFFGLHNHQRQDMVAPLYKEQDSKKTDDDD